MGTNGTSFDAIVVGSGIGGLGAAAALAKSHKRVAVVERHHQIGGLTQTFTRGEYSFGPGVHYVGGVGGAPGAAGRFGRLLDWLTDGRLRFASMGSPYDIVRLPGFEFGIESPHTAYSAQLKIAFPEEAGAIDSYFATAASADSAARKMFAARALPAPIAAAVRTVNAFPLRRALNTTTTGSVRRVRDQRLAGVLTARWALCAIPPDESPIAAHALATTHFDSGAYYPVGGPGRFAATLGDTIMAAEGELRTRCEVTNIRVVEDRAIGVRLASGEELDAPVIISAMGARNTVASLNANVAPQWRQAILSLEPSTSYIGFYLGFKGDIRKHGATPANVWLYEDSALGDLWRHPGEEPAPQIFVSFPTLRDREHKNTERHTAEGIVLCPWEPFARWADSRPGNRPAEYRAYKTRIEQALLTRFRQQFPRLAPLIDFCEISTPLSQASHTGADKGAMYGLGMSATRLRHPALRVRTPVEGLLLGGQDAAGPGLQAAFIGGYMAAASVEPALWKRINA